MSAENDGKNSTHNRMRRLQDVIYTLEKEFIKEKPSSNGSAIKNSKYHHLVDYTRELIFLTRRDGSFHYISPNSKELVGYELEELAGQPISKLLHNEDIDAVKDHIRNMVRTHVWLKDMEYRVVHRNGAIKWHLATCTPLTDEDGRIDYILGVARDVTEKKQYEHTLMQYVVSLEEQLLQAKRMRSLGELAGGILHGIKNNLGPVKQGLDLLSRRVKEKEIIEDLNILSTATQESYNLIMQILTYARVKPDEEQFLDVNHIIKSVIMLLSHAYPRIVFRTELEADLLPVKGKEPILQQVFMEICLNAKDALGEKGEIVVTSANIVPPHKFYRIHPQCHGPYVRISFKDNGPGMEENVQSQIFKPFFTTKDKSKGGGLGLALADKTIRKHGGIIELESIPGGGATFNLFFPAAQDATV